MRQKQIILPSEFISLPIGISCVYKLVFKSGQYYIGSTMNLKTRISAHKVVLKQKTGAFQRASYRGLTDTTIKYLLVIEYSPIKGYLKRRESKEIKDRKGDNKLLNHRRTNLLPVQVGSPFKPVELPTLVGTMKQETLK